MNARISPIETCELGNFHVRRKREYRTFIFFALFLVFFFVLSNRVFASPVINLDIGTTDDPAQTATSIQMLFLLAIIVLAPTILMMLTCFPRIIICFHFLRAAMATQQMPPNQILVALALFMTFALMGNTFRQINETALQPLAAGEISQETAFVMGMEPLREFMFRNVNDKDLALFWEISGNEAYDGIEEIPNEVLIPAFLLGEIKKGFEFGVLIYVPFIVIDMVVASILMSMGMMMLPPAMISLPFKLLLFVSVDGWNLVIARILQGFR